MSYSDRALQRPRTPKVQLICDCGCNQPFLRYRNKISPGLNFISQKHSGAYRSEKDLREKAGLYLPIVREYLDGSAKRLYRDRSFRNQLLPFFAFLCQTGVTSLTEVTVTSIGDFKLWAPQNGYKSAGSDTSAIGTFFEWARHSGHYETDNPVIPRVHGKVVKKGGGRPYTFEEIRHMRALLAERGNDRLRAFFELALASGLRNSEICSLHLKDVRLDEKDLVVGLPNKTSTERVSFFDDLVYDYLTTWLRVRRSHCDHDFLFHNSLGGPLSHGVIKEEFNRILCAPSALYPETNGLLKKFDLHRLRHTGASNLASAGAEANTVATQYGWADPGSRDGYVGIDEHSKVRGFVAAMEEVNGSGGGSAVTILSTEEFLASTGV